MTPHEHGELVVFLDDYDRGRMPGVVIPEQALGVLRQVAAEWVPAVEHRCRFEECGRLATWQLDSTVLGLQFCDEHPDDAAIWQQRYRGLVSAVEGSFAQAGSHQELLELVKRALRRDALPPAR